MKKRNKIEVNWGLSLFFIFILVNEKQKKVSRYLNFPRSNGDCNYSFSNIQSGFGIGRLISGFLITGMRYFGRQTDGYALRLF